MNMDNKDGPPKISLEHVERGDPHRLTGEDRLHGDRALKVVGDERVELTEEDVSMDWYMGEEHVADV